MLAGLFLAAAAAAGYWLYLRVLTTNFHTVVDGQVYRSAQPSPDQLKQWAAKYALRTIINLRGQSSKPFYGPERDVAQAAGVEMIDIRFSSIRLPAVPELKRLITALETAERPILLHCFAGADRTGVASVLAAMAVGGKDYRQARKQLSFRTLHFDDDDDHIAGLFAEYESWCRSHSLATAGWRRFKQWALQDYRTYYYYVQINAPDRLSAAPGQTVSVTVRIVNRSGKTIPAGDPDKTFTLAVFSGSSEADSPDREFAPRVELPKRDIDPGGGLTVTQQIIAPRRPGRYTIHFDLVEEHRTWFARQGSPVPTCELTVAAAE